MEHKIENNKPKKPVNKINLLFINIATKAFIFLILVGLFIFIVKILMNNIAKTGKEINALNRKNKSIITQTTNIVNKSIAAKKYIQVWEEEFTKNQKALTGISIPKIQKQIEEIASHDKLILNSVVFSPVVITGGSFDRATIVTYSTLVTVKFSTVTDINAFTFLDDLKANLDNFVIITEINLKRTKKITADFLKKLNEGTIMTAIDGEFKIRLYGIEQKK